MQLHHRFIGVSSDGDWGVISRDCIDMGLRDVHSAHHGIDGVAPMGRQETRRGDETRRHHQSSAAERDDYCIHTYIHIYICIHTSMYVCIGSDHGAAAAAMGRHQQRRHCGAEETLRLRDGYVMSAHQSDGLSYAYIHQQQQRRASEAVIIHQLRHASAL